MIADPGSDAVPLIFNPAAGGNRGTARFREARELLAERDILIEPVPTQGPRHAEDLAHDLARDGHKKIFVLGGDGTLSEAANGVLHSGKKPILGFLPAGTGNDFLRDFGCTARDNAADRIAFGKPHGIDAARLRYREGDAERERFFINIFGVGFAPRSVITTNKRYKWARGQAYNLGVIHNLLALKPTPTRLVLDGKEHNGDYPMVMVCNSIHTGSAMKMAPMARPDDGWFDVMYVDPVRRTELLKLLTEVRTGAHIRHPKVHFERARRIEIEPEEPSPLLADGEVYGSTPVDIELKKGALQVLL